MKLKVKTLQNSLLITPDSLLITHYSLEQKILTPLQINRRGVEYGGAKSSVICKKEIVALLKVKN